MKFMARPGLRQSTRTQTEASIQKNGRRARRRRVARRVSSASKAEPTATASASHVASPETEPSPSATVSGPAPVSESEPLYGQRKWKLKELMALYYENVEDFSDFGSFEWLEEMATFMNVDGPHSRTTAQDIRDWLQKYPKLFQPPQQSGDSNPVPNSANSSPPSVSQGAASLDATIQPRSPLSDFGSDDTDDYEYNTRDLNLEDFSETFTTQQCSLNSEIPKEIRASSAESESVTRAQKLLTKGLTKIVAGDEEEDVDVETISEDTTESESEALPAIPSPKSTQTAGAESSSTKRPVSQTPSASETTNSEGSSELSYEVMAKPLSEQGGGTSVLGTYQTLELSVEVNQEPVSPSDSDSLMEEFVWFIEGEAGPAIERSNVTIRKENEEEVDEDGRK